MRPGLGILLLLVTAIGWAGAWTTARLAAGAVSPLTVTWGRFVVASLSLLPAWWMLDRGARMRPGRGELLTLVAMSLTGIVGYTVLFMAGIALAPASDGAVIVPGLAGVFALALGALAARRAPPRRAVAAAAVSLAGCALVGAGAWSRAAADPGRITGDLLFVAGAATWGAYTVLGRRLADRVPAVTAVLAASVLGVVLLTPLIVWREGWPDPAAWSAAARWNVLYLGVVATALAFVTYYLGVRHAGLERTAPMLGLVPVLGVAGAAIFLDERPGPLALAGGVLVVAGIVLQAKRRGGAR